MKREQIKITKISNLRYKYIDEQEKSFDSSLEEYNIDNDKIIDELSNEIFLLIKKHKEVLSFEFIFEELTKLGFGICLLYDDNGHFAISTDGYQTISENVSDITMYNFIEKEDWKNNIREALYLFLDK